MMRVRAWTILIATIAIATSCAPMRGGAGESLAATMNPALCPTDPVSALDAFAGPLPNQPDALALLGCADPVTRVRAIAALGDADAPTTEAIAAIVAHLADPAAIVRQEALIATLRNADALRPALLARMAADPLDAPTAGADWAAAALWVIGQDRQDGRVSIKRPLPGQSRWQPLFELNVNTPAAAPAAKGPVYLLSPDTASRAAALPPRCHRNATTGKLPGIRLCRSGPPGATAYAVIVAAEEGLGEQVKAFEQAAAFALAHTVQWQARSEAFKSADQITCELTGSCGESEGVPNRGVSRKFSLAIMSKASKQRRQPPFSVRGARSISNQNRKPSVQKFGTMSQLPRFPWPAPRPVLQQPIPLSALGGPGITLGELADALRNRIQASDPNFEVGLFAGPPDGFVLLTRMERITDDGAPFPSPNRFTVRGNPSAGFWDAIRGLMAERPGHFRAIAFVVTGQIAIDPTRSPLSIPLDRIGEASALPAALARVPLGARKVFALVYAFERRPGKSQRPWTDGAPSALVHLRRSGIGSRIGL